mmetsp:Transcript_77405/g.230586  ORF Transcript_77405/g.230586 Transcript_77405/m.230586 type:complete len:217 (+) Transcript_77405:2431-3081(+)
MAWPSSTSTLSFTTSSSRAFEARSSDLLAACCSSTSSLSSALAISFFLDSRTTSWLRKESSRSRMRARRPSSWLWACSSSAERSWRARSCPARLSFASSNSLVLSSSSAARSESRRSCISHSSCFRASCSCWWAACSACSARLRSCSADRSLKDWNSRALWPSSSDCSATRASSFCMSPRSFFSNSSIELLFSVNSKSFSRKAASCFSTLACSAFS